ncbi:MAG: hypothetical protein FWD88_06570 [Treponema sp.]|nr:hypothetical protein [Treponema sp.]
MEKKLAHSAGNVPGVSVAHRLLLWSGVMRRFLLFVFNKKYIQKNALECKEGECLRCGACCRLVMKQCPYLTFESDGKSSCTKYGATRMPNCVIFPIDQRDIVERDIVSGTPCGYSFKAD